MNLNMKCRLVCAENLTSVATVCVRVTRWNRRLGRRKKKPVALSSHGAALVSSCGDLHGLYWKFLSAHAIFFFSFKYPPFPPPDSLLSFSSLLLQTFLHTRGILPSTLAPYLTWRSTWPNRPLIVKGTEGLLAVHALVLNFHPSHSSYV